MRRRDVLSAFGGAIAALGSPRLAGASQAAEPASTPLWHVIYPGTAGRTEALEHRTLLSTVLGPDVASSLRIAFHGGRFVVVYDRSHTAQSTSQARAAEVGLAHNALLSGALGGLGPHASAVAAPDLSPTWNIRYGDPGTPEALEARLAAVARILGPGVGKALFVEARPDGQHQLTYPRMGTQPRSRDVATHHSQLIASLGIAAVAVPDTWLPIARDLSTEPASQRQANTAPAPEGTGEAGPTAAPSEASGEADLAHAEPLTDVAPAGQAPPPTPVAPPASSPDAGRSSPLVSKAPKLNATDRLTEGTSQLRDEINEHIQQMRRAGRIPGIERTAWLVYDLHKDTTLAAINADLALQAASMIKPFVALAWLDLVSRGKATHTADAASRMELMLQRSSNTATNWFMQQCGGPAKVHKLLHDRYDQLVDGLQIVEYIPENGRTYRNLASAADHARLLRAIWRDRVPGAAELRRVLNLPSLNRIYTRVPEIPGGTTVYNKTGSTARCCGDMGILAPLRADGERYPYILVGIIERNTRASSYGSWVRDRAGVIREVSGLSYSWLKARAKLA